jgi:hypothetical protein
MTLATSAAPAGTRAATARAVLGVYPGLLSWGVAAASIAAATALAALRRGDLEGTDSALWLLRIAALVVAAGTVGLLDDASRNVTQAVAFPSWARAGLRILVAAAVFVAGLVPALVLVQTVMPVSAAWPGLALELATIEVVALAVTLGLQRWGDFAEPGQFGALGAALVFVGAVVANNFWPIFTTPGPEWSGAHVRWATGLVVAGVVVVACLRDPAAARVPGLRRMTPWSSGNTGQGT